jgi:hypothetical protein
MPLQDHLSDAIAGPFERWCCGGTRVPAHGEGRRTSGIPGFESGAVVNAYANVDCMATLAARRNIGWVIEASSCSVEAWLRIFSKNKFEVEGSSTVCQRL